jgi:hypothetical protein
MTVRQGTGTIAIGHELIVDTTVTEGARSWEASADLIADSNLGCDAITTAPPAASYLLLHLDGIDASTVIIDSGGGGETVTAHGAAQIDTAQSVFAEQALMVASESDYLSVDSGDYAFGTGDFCLETRARLSSGSVSQMFYDGGSSGPKLYYDGALKFESAAGTITGSALSADTNYHIAATRAGGSTRLWRNGVQQGSTLADATDYGTTAGYPRIGGAVGAAPIDELLLADGSSKLKLADNSSSLVLEG